MMDTLPDTLFQTWPDTWDLGALPSNETDALASSEPLDPGCFPIADTHTTSNGATDGTTDGDIRR